MSYHYTLYHGDCLEKMKLIPDASVDFVLCDLPFGTTACSWDQLIPFDPLWDAYRRVLKPTGCLVLFGSEPFSSQLRLSNLPWYRYDWVWEKSKATGFLNAKKRPLVAHEYLHVFYPKQPLYVPQMREGAPYSKGVRKAQTEDDVYGQFRQAEVKSSGQRYPRSVLYFKTAESEGKTYHKTQKPLALLKYMIQTYTQPGDVVLDNTMGSGSTGVATLQLGRQFIGIEKEEVFFQVAKCRLEETLITLPENSND